MSAARHECSAQQYRLKRQECCRPAWNQDSARRRAEAKAIGLPPGDPRHGTRNGFDHWGCRCGKCLQAKAATRRCYYETHTQQERERSRRDRQRTVSERCPRRTCPDCGRFIAAHSTKTHAPLCHHYPNQTGDQWCTGSGKPGIVTR